MSTDLLGKILALSCALLWSVAVIFFKRAGEVLRPTALNLYKTAIAAVFLLPFIWLKGESLLPPGITPQDWLKVVASGIIGIALSDSLFFMCLNLLGAGLTAIVDCLYSPMIMALSWLVLANHLGMLQVLGALLIIAAVLIATLKVKETAVSPKDIALGILLGAAAMFLMAVSIILMKPVLQVTSVFWVSEIRLLAAVVVLVIFILADKKRRDIFDSFRDKRNWRHAFPGTILGNVLSMTVWVAAFKLTDVTSAAILNQTNTIFIVILASLWLKEPFTFRRLVGTVLAFIGSALVLIS